MYGRGATGVNYTTGEVVSVPSVRKSNLCIPSSSDQPAVPPSTTLPQHSQPIWSLSDRLQDRHTIGGLQSQLKVHFWERELSKETDLRLREFLWAGVTKGFNIVDDVEIHPYHCRNYKSALTGDAFCYVDQLISDELADGKFLVAQSKPHCIHAIGAVSKADNTYRPITDCKRPLSVSINNYYISSNHRVV